MAIALHEEGTYTDTPSSTWDSIQTTSPNTTDGIYQVILGVNALVAGDTLEARFQVKDAAAGTLRTVWTCAWTGVQSDPGWVSPIVAAVNDWDFAMRQTVGTGRAIKWSIVKVT